MLTFVKSALTELGRGPLASGLEDGPDHRPQHPDDGRHHYVGGDIVRMLSHRYRNRIGAGLEDAVTEGQDPWARRTVMQAMTPMISMVSVK